MARRVAAEARQTWLAAHPADGAGLAALPLEDLAETQGVAIEYFAAAEQPHTLGYLDPADHFVWLSDALPPAIERFTLAHELGHWWLHRTDAAPLNCAAADVLATLENADLSASAQPEEAYSPRSRRERQANAFAAELLAPLDLIRRAYLGLDGTPPQSVEALAATCHVSKAVITNQLTRLLAQQSVARLLDDAPPLAPAQAASDSAQTAWERLDPSQRAAVTAPTPTLVVAGPGTGKTSTLVARVQWLAAQGNAPATMLALTFSRKAAQEMRERIGAALGTATPDALPTVTTFHRFCGDLLRSYGYLVGLRPDFRLVDDIGAFFVLRDLGSELPLHHYLALAAPTRSFGDLIRAISKAKDELVDPARYQELALAMPEDDTRARALEVAAIYTRYQAELARRGDADYGDLIRLTVRLFTEQPEVLAKVRSQYAHLLVDEFQDINRANGVLLRLLAGPQGNIWAVGDANQAIYRFRGASPANIARFREDYPGATITPLDQNYRSRPAIVAAANRFAAATLGGNGNPTLIGLNATRPAQADQMHLLVAPDGASEIAAIVADITRRHVAGTPWAAVAVLCRTRSLARQMTAALQAAGIPVEAQTDLFADTRIKDSLGIVQVLAGETGGLLRAARVADHAFSAAALRAILAAMQHAPLTISQAIAQVLADPALDQRDHAGLSHLQSTLAQLWRMPTITHALATYLYDATDLARQALWAQDTTAHHLAGLLALANRFDVERSTTANADLTEEAMITPWRAFVDYLRTVRTLPREAAIPAEDGPTDQVHVLTVHGAKGLEWPVVYVPRLAVRYFPASGQYDPTPAPPGMVTEGEDASRLLEEGCLFYVALTRARDTLILSRAERYSAAQRSSPSPFLPPIVQGDDLTPETVPALAASLVLADDEALPELLDGADFVPPEALSVGALATYDRCPRQYAYRYGYHFAGGRNTYGRLRRAVGAALRGASQSGSDEAALMTTFEEAWHTEKTQHPSTTEDDPFEALYVQHGRQAVAAAARHLRTAGDATPPDLGQTVEVAIAETLVRVELDRAETDRFAANTSRRVVRHRMGRRPTNPPDPDLSLYLHVLAQRILSQDNQADSIAEHYLNADEMTTTTLTPRQEERLRAQVYAALMGIRARAFPAQPEERKCAGCEFALICPA